MGEIESKPAHGLKPSFTITRPASNWGFEIELAAEKEFPPFSWLKVPGPCGARLELWLDDQTEARPSETNLVSTMHPAVTNAVFELIHSAPDPRWRGAQWWPEGGREAPTNQYYHLSGFDLGTIFNRPFTNDVVLRITPLIYKVGTNKATANLVELPPTKIKLSANGTVQKIE